MDLSGNGIGCFNVTWISSRERTVIVREELAERREDNNDGLRNCRGANNDCLCWKCMVICFHLQTFFYLQQLSGHH
ncbi:hypothetical protein [Lacrimispora sp.]|uniref:hypothetical protein n=1 Tax=Lacrimispora sp. TaxID=2719234 RepID=UPI00399204C7